MLPGRKSCIRAAFRPDSNRERDKIGPPACRRLAGEPMLRLFRRAKYRNEKPASLKTTRARISRARMHECLCVRACMHRSNRAFTAFTYIQVHAHAHRQGHREKDRQTNRQRDRQTDGRMDGRTDRHPDCFRKMSRFGRPPQPRAASSIANFSRHMAGGVVRLTV